jgi:hypothetical protein
MAKFRTQHSAQGGPGNLIRVIGLLLALVLLLYAGFSWLKTLPAGEGGWRPVAPEERFFLPATGEGEQIRHFSHYSICVGPGRMAPLWSAAEMDARMDEKLNAGIFIDSSFQMQMQPGQIPAWKELGTKGMQAARRLGRVFWVAGPIWESEDAQLWPSHFYCIWLDEGHDKLEALGVLLPNQAGAQAVPVSIDSIETLTGIDFFAEYWLDSLANEVENAINLAHWAPEFVF